MKISPDKSIADSCNPSDNSRLLSLDVFRGVTIVAMMLVNNPGTSSAVYAPLQHAAWQGWTFADLIFPFFLWIVGVAMTLSFEKRIERADNKVKLFLHVIRRAAIIFGLGLVLEGIPRLIPLLDFSALETIRIPGVLQRIAICYLVAGAIVLWAGIRGQAVWTISFLVVYWLMMTLIPVPGYGAGILDRDGNFAFYIDKLLLGPHKLDYDGLGVVSTLPAISTILFGVLTGHLLRWKGYPAEKAAWMFVGGNLLLLVGILMDWWIPINKQLWTPSFSVFTAGMAMNIFAVCYWLIDAKGFKTWAMPFAIYGMNALTVFALSEILSRLAASKGVTGSDGTWISLQGYVFKVVFAPLGSPLKASLYYALAWDLMLYLIAYIMYRE